MLVCLTCSDKSATNPDLCGIARAARKEEAARIVSLYEDEGMRFAEIAEQEGTSKARARKLYYEGLEIADFDKRKIATIVHNALLDDINDARRNLALLINDPVEYANAQEKLYKLYDRLMRYTGSTPPKERITHSRLAMPEPPDDPELADMYDNIKWRNS